MISKVIPMVDRQTQSNTRLTFGDASYHVELVTSRPEISCTCTSAFAIRVCGVQLKGMMSMTSSNTHSLVTQNTPLHPSPHTPEQRFRLRRT